jgi:Acetyltransferase (GNAT) family
MSKVSFAIELLAAAYAEASELTALHWQEVAAYKEITKINPDLDNYQQLENSGNLVLVTARTAGVLIGYIMMIIHPHPHYKHIMIGMDDLHFLHPEHRNGFTFMRMIDFTERKMSKRGVKIMVLRTKASKDHGQLFVRLGYQLQDLTYTRLIGDKDGI